MRTHRQEVESRLRLGDNSIGDGLKMRKLLGAVSTNKVHLIAHDQLHSLCGRMQARHSSQYSNVSMSELVALFGFEILCSRCVDKLGID